MVAGLLVDYYLLVGTASEVEAQVQEQPVFARRALPVLLYLEHLVHLYLLFVVVQAPNVVYLPTANLMLVLVTEMRLVKVLVVAEVLLPFTL